MREPDNFNTGDIIRYGSGSTALARLTYPHAGGWHADQCMGGSTFVSRRTYQPYRLADEEDMATWKRCAWYRGEAPPSQYKPRITKRDGVWRVGRIDRPIGRLTGVAMMKLNRWYGKAELFCERLNKEGV